MRLDKIYVPYQDNTFQGVFRAISNKTREYNISKVGLTSCSCSSNQKEYDVSVSDILIESQFKQFTWWSTAINDTDKWMKIDMGPLRVDIEGYSINTNYDDVLKSWEILGSTDGNSWSIIHSGEYSSIPLYNKMVTINSRTSSMRIRSIMMRANNISWYNSSRFCIYNFDIFGRLIIPKWFICTHLQVHYLKLAIPLYCFVFL